MNIQAAISQAAQVRNAAIAEASRSAPDYAAFDAAAAKANALYRRTVDRAWRKAAR